ncbi:hypothetical protein [Natrinema longum]|uniref:Uncharacterized protein n=1 Tax=Natrinema longum TaxID=370324 RepID=A0A8A2U8U7_9EURY|nr:hypothetical protein [Natrinema longum]MBZ6493534.1 hypothetical protein [Natrinema longum]QSW85120.1 hypothetical protein J0X27_17005 [Natrinema longum]
MDRTELFLAIIAYTLIVRTFGREAEGAMIPLFVLLFALPIYVVVHLFRNPSLD